MRLYWPKTEAPSVLPVGQGTWQPPGVIPVRNDRARNVTRFGDKSLETVIRTDERYGDDSFFQGPRAGLTGTCSSTQSRSRTRTSGLTRSPPTSCRALPCLPAAP